MSHQNLLSEFSTNCQKLNSPVDEHERQNGPCHISCAKDAVWHIRNVM